MAKLEDLKRGALVTGLLPGDPVTVVGVDWAGADVIDLTYRTTEGRLGGMLVYRDAEARFQVSEPGQAWSFNEDGGILRLALEAYRIRLAHLFDPLLAVHTSVVDPLPHQITAVYEEMLPRQPLRFLLADDPGAGKTIMAGLLIKELMVRGDVRRCLVCCPGNLVDQWQDELWRRFQLDFKILSNQSVEEARTGNPFAEEPFLITRLDHLSRNEELQGKIGQCEWDLVVVDEAHKMSAHYYGQEVRETKRYRLGKLLGASDRTRHFLLMTATPHNGKEEDFQLFLALLDGDRFEGRFRDGVHTADTTGLMRRLVKERLVKFDGTPLFPERFAYTVSYQLSDAEAALYKQVTDYVRDQMNRADRLTAEGEGRRGNRVGFALTTLQRRLASSPEAIYSSLRRRRERLENRLREERLLARGAAVRLAEPVLPDLDEDAFEAVEDLPDGEVEAVEEEIVEQASAARTIAELEAEIVTLRDLEQAASRVRQSKTDKKWEELSVLLQNNEHMFDPFGARRKLIVFTEHRDTLNYLLDRIRTLLGRDEAVVVIHGAMAREERRNVQEAFTQDKEVQVLVATDAAGEGINLQRAHLMVNYDLPWNPNRLEQRFGRIHRIGQTEVCHMWNLVARETREGEVFARLLEKLEAERAALGGGVFDVLGKCFQDTPLRKLLIDAIRYGDQPEVRARTGQILEMSLDRIRELLQERALVQGAIDDSRLHKIRMDMERAEAARLQPHYIRSFFLETFKRLGGSLHEREPKRYEITRVPSGVRSRDRQIGTGPALLSRYERVCFEKDQMTVPGKPLAEFVCPGHPLLDVSIDLVLEYYRNVLRKGALLLDPRDSSEDLRALFFLEHSIEDARENPDGSRRTVSKQLQFIEMLPDGTTRAAGPAPHLDYRPLDDGETRLVTPALEQQAWLRHDLEPRVRAHAAQWLAPRHLKDVAQRKEEQVTKVMAAVKQRLTVEINYWDYRANELKERELAGHANARLNSGKARERADELQVRLQKRLADLEKERHVTAAPPRVIGGALVVPLGLLERLKGARGGREPALFARDRDRVEQLAMEAVMAREQALGRTPADVSAQNLGYDIESYAPGPKRLYFIEVKGRAQGAATVTVTKNEILTALNKPDAYVLALVHVSDEAAADPVYIRRPFSTEPDFAVTSVNYDINKLLARAEEPA